MTLKELLNNGDRFAKENGMQITEIREGYAKAEMDVEKRHLNGGGVCQGGALFTLADLAFAAVTNSHGLLTLGIQNSVSYVHSAQLGDHLTAEAIETADHKKLPFCTMTVKNQNDEVICIVTGMAYRKKAPMEYEGLC